jgi:hypothetical protein
LQTTQPRQKAVNGPLNGKAARRIWVTWIKVREALMEEDLCERPRPLRPMDLTRFREYRL